MSRDSDYYCRFIFVRCTVSLWPGRNVIETPLERDLDVNACDVGKALKLKLKGSAVVSAAYSTASTDAFFREMVARNG